MSSSPLINLKRVQLPKRCKAVASLSAPIADHRCEAGRAI